MASLSPTKRLVAHTDEEYYYKLDNILLSSCQNLRSIFNGKWKRLTGEDWVNEKENGAKLINSLNKQTKTMVQRGAGGNKIYFEKLSSGNVEHWDITILAMILLNLEGPAADVTPSENSQQNEAVKSLRDLRNFVAHHPNKKLSKDEYTSNMGKFQKAMKDLKVDETEIKRIVEKAGVSSSIAAMKKVEELYRKAAKLIKEKKFPKAMECYAEAISMPSLLPIQLASVFEMRAQDYLKISNGKKEVIQKALEDLDQALELNESSWNAHYIAGQCYRKLEDYPKAIQRLQKSLSISPVQKQVKNELDSCKVLQGIKERGDHLTKNHAPLNFQERLDHLEDETGLKLSEADFIKFNDMSAEICKGQDHVFKAHRYFGGWGVEQNYTEAARHYGQAAKLGNAEGIYNLALCYQHGRGVAQDIQKAISYFHQAAELSPDLFGNFTRRKKNLGVASSMHSLGLCYEKGIGVVQDLQEAVKWYKKGMENGLGNSANNLGIFYSKGLGVPKDRKMAEMCWKEAMNLLDENAPLSLIAYYITEMEPDLALGVFKTVKQMKIQIFTDVKEKEFASQTETVRLLRKTKEPEVQEFEQTNKLNTKGLTFKERLHRVTSSKAGNSQFPPNFPLPMMRLLQQKTGQGQMTNKPPLFNLASFSIAAIVEEIKRRAEGGSQVAQRVVQLLRNSIRLIKLIQPTSPFYKEENVSDIIELLYNCVTLPFDELIMKSEDLLKVRQILQHLFETKAGEKGKDDKRIRLAYAVINVRGHDDNFALELLKEGTRRYPENQFYHFYLSKVYETAANYPEAIKSIKEGFNIVPGDIHFLFEWVNIFYKLRLLDSVPGMEEEISFLLSTYLTRSSEDDINVLEAYFMIALCYIKRSLPLSSKGGNPILRQAQEMYQRGLQAEKWQLPCFEKNLTSEVYKAALSSFPGLTDSGISNTVGSFLESDNDKSKPGKSKTKTVSSVLDQKPYLRAPTRKQLVRHFRNNFLDTMRINKGRVYSVKITKAPKLKQTLPQKSFAKLKPITLQEMNPTSDQIYYDRVLDLTIIDSPALGNVSIHLLAEDENGDVTLFYVYNVEQNPKVVEETFGLGCKVAVMNPYLRLAMDATVGIRNDEPKCLVYLGRIQEMCRCCGGEGAQFHCSKCKEARYCSRECQEFDWKEFGHKIICSEIAKGKKK